MDLEGGGVERASVVEEEDAGGAQAEQRGCSVAGSE
jgi:hypothetical protein